MLVLSRRKNQSVVLPDLNVVVELLQIQGKAARVGVTAPDHVRILRGELTDPPQGVDTPVADGQVPVAPAKGFGRKTAEHAYRNLCNTIRIGLHLLRRQYQAGLVEEAQSTLDTVLQQVATSMEAQGAATGSDDCRKLRGLLVEDDPNERHLLAGYLKSSGFEIVQASDGCEALTQLDEIRPDFVLMDMLMPNCDGPTAVRKVRQQPRWRDLKIFAVSGTEPQQLGLGIGQLGVNRWFQKPLDPEALVTALQGEITAA